MAQILQGYMAPLSLIMGCYKSFCAAGYGFNPKDINQGFASISCHQVSTADE